MKLFSLIKLGHTNISAFKKRSFMTIVVIGVSFGALFTLLFSFQGLENLLLNYARQATNGSVLIATSACTVQDEVAKNCTTDRMLSKTTDLVTDYGGKVEGVRHYYYSTTDNSLELLEVYSHDHHTIGNFYSLPSDVLNPLNIPKTNTRPTNQELLPVIIPFNEALTLSEIRLNKLQTNDKIIENTEKVQTSTLGQTFAINNFSAHNLFASGIYPAWSNDFSLAKKASDFNILDIVLSNIASNQDINGTAYFSDTINPQEYNLNLTLDESSSKTIVRFNDARQAYAYYSYINCLHEETTGCNRGTAEELFSNQLAIVHAFSVFKRIFNYAAIALMVMGAIIMVFTFIRLIDQDKQNIALYRSLGANGRDIFIIYLSFLLELCVFTTIFAILLGAILSFVLSFINSSPLSAMLTAHYLITPKEPIILFGINQSCLNLIIMILAIAPICSLLSIDHFSNKNLAKKMKQN